MRINEDFIKDNMTSECVLIPTGDTYQNGIFTLNETAERIYNLLCEGKDRDEIVAALCEEYDTDQKTAEEYTDEYIAQLREAGILLDD